MPKIISSTLPPGPRLELEPTLLFDQRAVALGERPERFVRRDFANQLVVIPRFLGLCRALDLIEVHRMDLAPVHPHRTLAEYRIVGGHLLHLLHHRLAVGIAL